MRSEAGILAAIVIVFCSGFAMSAATTQSSLSTPSQPVSNSRDGSHDFDFNLGLWHSHIQRILDPFSASSKSIVLDGTVAVRKIWNGKALLEEMEADGPNGHWEGASMFLYNPEAHQWSQTFVNSKVGVPEPPLIGSFNNGRGQLFDQDTFQGKTILVQGVWSDITPDSHHYEELYSNDGGQTWCPAFIAVLTREKGTSSDWTPPSAGPATPTGMVSQKDQSHAFDWDIGKWNIHMSRLSHPLTGSTTWNQMDGITMNSKVWDGRSNLAEVEAKGPAGELELLAWRLYNPSTQEWTTSFATSSVGVLNTPTGRPITGEFKNGRGVFYDQEPYNGKNILVRFSIWPTSDESAQSEQAFSDDGGKTWETNWVNKYSRINSPI
jgi:hypothetical protein